MIRKLLLPLVAVALLGGCMSSYSYRSGSGDYYYGAPSVEYRHYPSYYSGYYYGGQYGYGYPYGYYGRSVYDYRYDSPYRYHLYYNHPYGNQYYGYPYRNQYYGYPYRNQYYGYPYRQPNHTHRRPGPRPTVDPTPDGTGSPWRDFDRLRRRGIGDGGDATQPPRFGPLPDGDANTSGNTERLRAPRRELERRRAPVVTEGSTQPRGIAPQPLPPRYSSPESGGDGRARTGRVRDAKGDPAGETAP